MGAEGFCVNIPWSRGGVGDNDYIFAFQHVVLPIGDYQTQPGYVFYFFHFVVYETYRVTTKRG